MAQHDETPGNGMRGRAATGRGAGAAPDGGPDKATGHEVTGHAGARDSIDRAATEESAHGQSARHPEGAAAQTPAAGAVLSPAGEGGAPGTGDAGEDARGGEGAGDALRGGGAGGPLPPGTGATLDLDQEGTRDATGVPPRADADPEGPATPDPQGRDARPGEDRSERVAAAPAGTEDHHVRVAAAGAADVPRVARTRPGAASRDEDASDTATLMAGDGPTAAEAGPAGPMPGGPAAAAPYALGRLAARRSWVLWVLGGLSLLAGALALMVPVAATLAAVTLVAAMLVASGVAGLVAAFRSRRAGAGLKAMAVATAILSVLAGALLIAAPLAGTFAISTLVIAYFAASGIMKLWYGLRGEVGRARGWVIASGALSLVLAVFLWFGLPAVALWLPGVLLAVELILTGTLLLSLAAFGKPKIDAERRA